MTDDTRWKQRYSNYRKALQTLGEAVQLAQQRSLSKLEMLGVIHAFEFAHELAWNVLKDYLDAQGFVGLVGSKNATRQAFKDALIQDGDAWMDMIKARNLTSHTYNTDIACGIAADILTRFYPAVERAVLYGSRAKGNYKPGSDIDLTLYGTELTSALCATIADALDDLLLPYTIDLSVFAELKQPELEEHIQRVGVVFFERKDH